jgi:hypothetical protein
MRVKFKFKGNEYTVSQQAAQSVGVKDGATVEFDKFCKLMDEEASTLTEKGLM